MASVALLVLLMLVRSSGERPVDLEGLLRPVRSVHAELRETEVESVRQPSLGYLASGFRAVGFSGDLYWIALRRDDGRTALVGLDAETDAVRSELRPKDLWPPEEPGTLASLGKAVILSDGLVLTVSHFHPETRASARALFFAQLDGASALAGATRLQAPAGWSDETVPRILASDRRQVVVEWHEPEWTRRGLYVHADPWSPPTESDRLGAPDDDSRRGGRNVAIDGDRAAVDGTDRIWVHRRGPTGWEVDASVLAPVDEERSPLGLVSGLALREQRLAVIWYEPRRLGLYERSTTGWNLTREEPCDPDIFFSGSPSPLGFAGDRLVVGAQAPGDYFDHLLVVPLDGGPATRLDPPWWWRDDCFGRALVAEGQRVALWCHGGGSIDSHNHPNCPNLTVLDLAR